MVTLYKRATPPQAMLLRVVEGSIKNACDAHKVEFNPYFARSVAKRAAGTLSGCWPDVLAAKPSEKQGPATCIIAAPAARAAHLTEAARGSQVVRPGVGKSHLTKASPLRQLETWMFRQMRAIKASGNEERARAFIDVLRHISSLKGI
jgi:hypothetical protein